MTQTGNGAAGQDEQDVRALQRLLASQAREIEKLSKELAASYRKELIFFDNLEQRDRRLAKLERQNQNLQALRSSPGGVAQRAYWAGGKKLKSKYWLARKKILKGGRA